MKPLLCIALIFLLKASSAQETTRKVNSQKNGDREVYYVLASDPTVLHGRYQKTGKTIRVEGYYKNGNQDSLWKEYSFENKKFLRVQGEYKDGLKDGLWTVYLSKNKFRFRGRYKSDKRTGLWKFYNMEGELEEVGDYNEGVRTGVWTFYNKDGMIGQEYDYTTRDLVSDISIAGLKGKKFRIINGTDTIVSLVERPPVFIGGDERMHLSRYKSIPVVKDSGKVEISFTISKMGNTRNHKIISTTDRRLNNEALNLVYQLPVWVPAKLNGQAVDAEYTLTVSFKKVDRELTTTTNFIRRSGAIGNNVENPFLYQNPGYMRGGYPISPIRVIYIRTCQISIL
jgi:antitoxin component YwqK of YwqJK toxin-antitoxin module